MRLLLFVVMTVSVIALASAALTAEFAVRPTDGASGWYTHVPLTATTGVTLDDKSMYAKLLFSILGDDKLSGSSDLSAKVWLGYDANYLYWHAAVTDDVVTNIADRSASYLGDALEIGVAASDTDAKRTGILIRSKVPESVYTFRPDGGQEIFLPMVARVTVSPSDWTTEGSVLLSDVGLTVGVPFRLNILIYDRDEVLSVGQDTILGLSSSADVGYNDLSVWSDAVWIVDIELPEPRLLNAEIKKLTDNTPLQLVGVFVTLVSARDHCFFVENQDRIVGLKVNFPSTWQGVSQVVAGQIVDSITGTIKIRHNQREMDADSVSIGITGQFVGPEPFCVRGKDLGGSDPYDTLPRVGGLGPSNVGLLVKVVGQIKSILPTGDFVISSGDDIFVYYSGTLPPIIGATVSITGVVTTNAGDPSKIAIQAGSTGIVMY